MGKRVTAENIARLWINMKNHVKDGYVAKVSGKGLSTEDYTLRRNKN